ncbi:MAG: hypothetical protein ACJATM_001362 [Alphaproteobacteria bacterium]|jgi:hypothetical protein|tara:strand:+ start:1694 stop:2002 length:309 start_codon:yes stop_codon:yes gene_type:complete
MKNKSLAKQINQKLDEILAIRQEIKRMDNDLKDDTKLKNLNTGESANKEEALRVVEGMVDQIKEELNQITNNGRNVREIFTNKFYINDMLQDKDIVHNMRQN